jgi:signal peptidase I
VNVFALLLPLLPLLAIRFFGYQPFSIPSGSMSPTILVGDYIFANKFAYGYGRYSFPLSPSFSGRLWGAEPKRGDIAIFRLPGRDRIDYIKRIVGLPGDEIAMSDGVLTINGEAVQRERLGNPPEIDGRRTFTRYNEILPNGVSYQVFETDRGSSGDNMSAVQVPAGHYFVLGDSRDNSTDSRHLSIGFIPFENLIGRASIVFFSYGGGQKAGIRWNRIFQTVH